MPVNVISTINGLCKRCFSCIRNCPAKAIKVEEGQAMVMPELCIGCAQCVQVCSQNAKKIAGGIEKTQQTFNMERSIACLAPSFISQFPQYHPGQMISALKKLGFTEVWEVAFGANLVTEEYKNELFSQKANAGFISTACPAIVNLVEKHYPQLISLLVPIVSPMIALGRYLKTLYGQESGVVFIGPCAAKKEEAEDPMVEGAIDAVLTFQELDQMLQGAKINPEDLSLSEWDSPSGNLGRLYPVSGGLLRSAGKTLDPLKSEILKIDGKENCLSFFDAISKDKSMIKFADVLFCDGCISSPLLKSNLNKLDRQNLIVQYTKNSMAQEEPTPITNQIDIDMTRHFRNRNKKQINPTDAEIKAVLAEMGKFIPEDELNCGACGYNSCREKAVAVFRGFAESKMCLPSLITSLESHNVHLKKQLNTTIGIENIVGNSHIMENVYEIIKKVAPTNNTVLIRGKSGTGKELVAQALHHHSLRNKNIFASINCAALTGKILESEIFGHAKGAFAGAISDKKGLLEEANNGTLLLDGIGYLSLALQGKLLWVLQEGEFFRIGETIPRKCNARIIAATNQNLEELISEKKFREDLYYRLNAITINLPDLQERRDDIPILIKYFLEKFNAKHQKEILKVSKEALKNLIRAPWLGNVRELENTIERAVILCDGTELRIDDFPPSLMAENSKNQEEFKAEAANYHLAIEEYKKKVITRALRQANGIQAQAARDLGIGRSTLNEIIKKLNINI